MKILMACEESQAVTIRMREKGHEAYSCDILPSSGGHPEWHLQQDVAELIEESWDMIIAFPPCTYLTTTGNRWFSIKRHGDKAIQRRWLRGAAINFFMLLAAAKSEKIAIENPSGIMSTVWRKPDQTIQPYEFGHMEQKRTCFWLKNLPRLKPTKNVYLEMMLLPKNQRERLPLLPPGPERAKIRSKTFPGIAQAMADQWG